MHLLFEAVKTKILNTQIHPCVISILNHKQDHNRSEKLIGVANPLPSTVENHSENIHEI